MWVRNLIGKIIIGKPIGPGHPRYERTIRKEKQRQQIVLKSICADIMLSGMPKAKNQFNTYEQIISVLKRFPNCPKFEDGKLTWGDSEHHIHNWKQAQEWLKAKENPKTETSQYIKQLEQKNQDLEDQIKKLKQKFVEYENE